MEQKELGSAYNLIAPILDNMSKNLDSVTDEDRALLIRLYRKLCQASSISEKSAWVCQWAIEKFKSKDDKVPYAVENFGQNVILNAGASEMLKLICGQSAYPFDSANAIITVGNSSVPEDASQTGVVAGGVNSSTANMSAGYPRIQNGTMVFSATFDENQANFQWNEISVGNGIVALNRKVISGGQIKSGDIWAARCTISISS